MKSDLKKTHKELYAPSTQDITIVDVPRFQFLMIDGRGDPNTSRVYSEAVEALFSTAYTVKFMMKKTDPKLDYSVMPLEGLWWMPDMKDFSVEKKEAWYWRMMIMQPETVTPTLFKEAAEIVRVKKGLTAVENLFFESMHEGLCAQILYHGPYSGEGPVIAQLHAFVQEQGRRLNGKHHEIYLNDPRRTRPEKLKTIIRQPMI